MVALIPTDSISASAKDLLSFPNRLVQFDPVLKAAEKPPFSNL